MKYLKKSLKKNIGPSSAFIKISLFGLALLSIGINLLIGSAELSWSQIITGIWPPSDQPASIILWQIRGPRVLAAFAIGSCLALAGLMMQVLLLNPLADPYVLGLAGSAALAVLLAMLLGLSWSWQMPLAWLGALLNAALLFYLAQRSQWQPLKLILTGVVLAAGWSAMISLILSIAPHHQLPSLLFWLMGDLSQIIDPSMAWIGLIIGWIAALRLAPQLDVHLLGEIKSASLGIDLIRLKQSLFLLSSALTALCVSLAGSIGFVGLIAPHLARLLVGQRHRELVPATALLGGLLLLWADTAARILIAPMQLPVGVLTALFGVPLLIGLLYR